MSEITPTPDRDAPAQTVGNIMQTSRTGAIKAIVIFMSILIYLAGIIYAEVHGLSMLSNGVDPEFVMWAYIGMMALGLTAIALPLALHFWTFATMQRIWAFGFYAADFALLILNAFLDYATNTGGEIAGWGQLYLTYIMPATPVFCAIGWAVIWLLDPSTKAHVLRQTLKNSIIEAKANQIATAASRPNVSAAVNEAAQQEVESALTELFGRPVTMTPQAGYSPVNIPHPTQENNFTVPRVELRTKGRNPLPGRADYELAASIMPGIAAYRACPQCDDIVPLTQTHCLACGKEMTPVKNWTTQEDPGQGSAPFQDGQESGSK